MSLVAAAAAAAHHPFHRPVLVERRYNPLLTSALTRLFNRHNLISRYLRAKAACRRGISPAEL